MNFAENIDIFSAVTKIKLIALQNKEADVKCDDCNRQIKVDEEVFQYEINKALFNKENYKLCKECNDNKE